MTSDVTYAVYFNSGQNSNSNTYTNNSNISRITINNSDQDYYQTGIIELYKCSQQDIGNSVDIYINDSLEFSGYVSRKQMHHKAGVHLYTYQLVGKTYDLWRYRTGDSAFYTGYSGYIASSLVRDYCENIHGNSNTTDGNNFTTEIDFSDMTVGDAIITLIGYDGFKFYIDNNENLIYYDPNEEPINSIHIVEDDILDMSPVEEDDEDLINDILIIGAENFYEEKKILLPEGKPISQVSSGIFKRNMYIAQRIKAEEDTLTSISMFLDRSKSPNEPNKNIEFELWNNTTQQIFSDDFYNHMKYWLVTSNVFFEDGFLKLNSGFENISQNQQERNSYPRYHAQIVKFSNAYTIESAFIYGGNSGTEPHTYWIELRDTAGGLLHTPNNVLSSGSVTMSSFGIVDYLVNLNPKYTVNNTDYYALVIHPDNPTTYDIRGYYMRSDVYGDGYCYKKYCDDGTGTTWYSNTDMDLYFGIRAFSTYAKSGYALSKPFGTPSRRVYTRYMKIDLDGVTSSNRIFISGSNSGSKNFRKCNDGGWYDFGFENKFSSQIKIMLSSNGTYTPKVDSVSLSTADSTAGPESTVFTDTFTDYTYLDLDTRHKVRVNNSLDALCMTGQSVHCREQDMFEFYTTAPYSKVDGVQYNLWSTSSNIVDGGSYTTSPAISVDSSVHNFSSRFDIENLKETNFGNVIVIIGNSYSTTYYLRINTIYLSGNWAGRGWIKALSPNLVLDYAPGAYILYTDYYYKVKRILISGTYRSYYTTKCPVLDSVWMTKHTYCINSGSIESKNYNVYDPIINLRINPSEVTFPNKITYSGSKDSGTSWYKILPNIWNPLGNSGPSGHTIKIMYCMKPSTMINVTQNISSSVIKSLSPYICAAEVKYSKILGGGLPKSGTKIEHSDDIYIEPTNVPYPPSYSSYVSYQSPKLRQSDGSSLETENYYWIVMHAYSGAKGSGLRYWKYYYDCNSDYTDGAIAYSTGNSDLGLNGVGVVWKTHDLVPTWVPAGSLIMNIGWKGDEQIRATAVNDQSINKYGRHQKIIRDSRINSYTLASSMANEMVRGMDEVVRKGSITIRGESAIGIETSYKLSSNLSNLGIGGLWEIVSYTHNIDKNGFTTTINYGKQPFDITKRINELEKEVY